MESFGFLMLCLALVSMASCQSKTAGDFPTVMTWYQYAGLTVPTSLQVVAPRGGVANLQQQLACTPTVLLFDNIVPSGSYTPVPAGYGGLQYANLDVFDARDFPGTGIATGDVSPSFTIGNADGLPFAISVTSGTFDLQSLYATLYDGNPGPQITVVARANTGAQKSINLVSATGGAGPVLVQFGPDFQGVTTVTFTISAEYTVVLDNLAVAVPSLSSTVCGGGDPWFNSFTGMRFPFDGVPGQSFNLVSEQSHQVNALFVAEANPRHSALHGVSTGTWMQKIGFQYSGVDYIKVAAITFHKISVSASGATVVPGAVLRLGACTVTMLANGNNTAIGPSETVIIETPRMRLTIWAPLGASISGDSAEDQATPGLDWNLAVTNPAEVKEMHGVVGQTWASNDETGQAKDAFTFAHQLQRDTHLYRVSDIFASDFAFNKFDPDAEMMPASAPARRLFHAEHARDSGLQAGSALLHDLMGAAK